MKSSSHTIKIIVGLGAAVCVLLVCAIVGFYVWLNQYLNSEEFRKLISEQTSNALGVDGTYDRLTWSGFSVYTNEFKGKAKPSSPIGELTLRQIRAHLNFRAIFSGVWKITSIDIQRLDLSFKEPEPERPEPPPTIESLAAQPQAKSFLPSKVEIDEVTIHNANLSWPAGEGRIGTLSETKATGKPAGNSMWNITGENGKLDQPGLPAMTLGDFALRYGNDFIYITRAQLKHPEQGLVILSGEMELEGKRSMDIAADFQNYPVTPLLPTDWRARLHGGLYGSTRITGSLDQPKQIHAEGDLELKNGRVEALPFLNKIDAYLSNAADYRSFRLDQARFHFRHTPEQFELTKLEVESKSLIRVEGGLTKQLDSVSGTFQLGTTEKSLKKLLGAKKYVFSESKNGYLWTPVTISGTWPDAVKEDLSPRLQEAFVKGAQEEVAGAVDEIKQQGGQMLEQTREAVDQFRSLFQ